MKKRKKEKKHFALFFTILSVLKNTSEIQKIEMLFKHNY